MYLFLLLSQWMLVKKAVEKEVRLVYIYARYRLCQSKFSWSKLKQKNVAIKVIDQNIDTNDATGRLLFNMLGAIS